jgi:hypothetical protein
MPALGYSIRDLLEEAIAQLGELPYLTARRNAMSASSTMVSDSMIRKPMETGARSGGCTEGRGLMVAAS